MPATKQKTSNQNADFVKQATSGLTYAPGKIVQRAALPLPMAETDPALDSQSDHRFPVRVNGQPTEADLALINKLSRSGNVNPDTIYCFDCAPSSQRVDALGTRMDLSSLQNYASDALLGAPVMNSHRTGGRTGQAELPVGRSFWGGTDDDPQMAGSRRFVSSAYMLRNNRASGAVNTDDLIAGIEAGTLSDISIGFAFKPGTPENNFQDRTWFKCSICGLDAMGGDWWDYDNPDVCHHWPLETYTFDGGKQTQLCYYDVMNAGLAEYSLVYAGATDGAIVLKAQRAAQMGILTRSQVNHFENLYHVRLLDRAAILMPEKPAGLINISSDTSKPKSEKQERNSMPQTKKNDTSQEARQEGARTALANFIKSIIDSRGKRMTDAEMASCKAAMDCVAAGDMDGANAHLSQLMDSQSGTDEGATNTDEAEPDDAVYEVGMEDEEAGTVEAGATTQTEGAHPEPDADDAGGPSDDDEDNRSLTLFQLSASERSQYRDLQKEVKTLRKQVRELQPLAEIGERYRDTLVEQTVKQAVRAQIPNMDEARVRRMCANLSIEDVEALYQDYRERAFIRLGQHEGSVEEPDVFTALFSGGRQTQAADPNTPPVRLLPNGTRRKVNDIGAYSTR